MATLSPPEIAAFHRDGFVIRRAFFSEAEASLLRTAVVNDAVVDQKQMAMKDGAGKEARLTLWLHVQPQTCYGAAAASRRMVQSVRDLFGGREVGPAQSAIPPARAPNASPGHSSAIPCLFVGCSRITSIPKSC